MSEDVTLRDETVTIDRHAVDRPVAALGADAFKERTIEMEEIDEEAVVGKTARVVEEIGIRKDVSTAPRRSATRCAPPRSTSRTAARSAPRPRARTTGFASRLVKDMEVVGSDGVHVGVIDRVDGTMMKLKRKDSMGGGQHHLLPVDLVKSAEDKVMLSISSVEAMRRWKAV